MKIARAIVLSILTAMSTPHLVGQKRPATPRDCVATRYLLDLRIETSIKIDPTGANVAYLVKEPRIETNQNEILLYVKSVAARDTNIGRLLLTGANISQIRWLEDGRHIRVLARDAGSVAVVEVDVTTGAHVTLVRASADITDYTTDASGDTVVFAVETAPKGSSTPHTAEEIASGYRIAYETNPLASVSRRRVYLTRKNPSGAWTTPEAMSVQSPFTGETMNELPMPSRAQLPLELSPDGRFLLLSYYGEYPDSWRRNSVIKLIERAGRTTTSILLLKDVQTGATSMPVAAPSYGSTPLWFSDSRSFVVSGSAPIGSVEEAREIQQNASPDTEYLLWAELSSGKVLSIVSGGVKHAPRALWVNKADDLMVRTAADTISRFAYHEGEWRQEAQSSIPLPEIYLHAQFATDGKRVIGDYQNIATPPELFTYVVGDKTVRIFAKLNPEFDQVLLGTPSEIHWKTSTGYEATGILLMPPGHTKGDRYPLVIQNYPRYTGQFLCDFGPDDDPSFIPQPLVDAGIMYLLRPFAEEHPRKEEQEHYPKGYPGGVGEAAFHLDLMDAAVDYLDKNGLVDRSRVGIIGFSRGGWYTEFALTHSRTPFRAATVVDNVQYSLGEYWLYPTGTTGTENMFGGPPYGTSLPSWISHSISFNLDRIRTPLLMEKMGYGYSYDDESVVPTGLAEMFEVFNGLMRLHKPVELYYYPNEGHQPEHPKARLASLERNLDWFRFWLQGRTDAHDPEQYLRWRKLLDMQNANDSAHQAESSTGGWQ